MTHGPPRLPMRLSRRMLPRQRSTASSKHVHDCRFAWQTGLPDPQPKLSVSVDFIRGHNIVTKMSLSGKLATVQDEN